MKSLVRPMTVLSFASRSLSRFSIFCSLLTCLVAFAPVVAPLTAVPDHAAAIEPPNVGAAAASAGIQIMISHSTSSVSSALMKSSMTIMIMLEICSSWATSPDCPAVPWMPVANCSRRLFAASFASPVHAFSASSASVRNFCAYCSRPCPIFWKFPAALISAGPSPDTKWMRSCSGWTTVMRKFRPCPISQPSGSVAMPDTASLQDCTKVAPATAAPRTSPPSSASPAETRPPASGMPRATFSP